MQLDKRAGELGAEAKTLGKVISLELELARENVEEQLDDGVHGGESIREENEADDDGVLSMESERVIERLVVEENREEGEDIEKVGLVDESVSLYTEKK